jgi:hypothetical protein
MTTIVYKNILASHRANLRGWQQAVFPFLISVVALILLYNNQEMLWVIKVWAVFLCGWALASLSGRKENVFFATLIVAILTEYRFRVVGVGFSMAEVLMYFCFTIALVAPRSTRTLYEDMESKDLVSAIRKSVLVILFFSLFALIGSDDVRQSLHRLREFVLPLFLILVIVKFPRNRQFVKTWGFVVVAAATISTLVCYAQFFEDKLFLVEDENFQDTVTFKASQATSYLIFQTLGFAPERLARGLNTYSFGYSEVMFLPSFLLLSYVLISKKRLIKVLLTLLLFFIVGGIFISGSRSVLLLLFFGFFVYALVYKRMLIESHLWWLAVAFQALLFAVPSLLFIFNVEELGTLLGRFEYLKAFETYVWSYPQRLLMGSDVIKFMERTGAAQPPHHFYLFSAVYDGLIVATVFLLLIIRILRFSWKRIEKGFKERRDVVSIVQLAVWLAIFVRIFLYGQTTYLTWSTAHNIELSVTLGFLIRMTIGGQTEHGRVAAGQLLRD